MFVAFQPSNKLLYTLRAGDEMLEISNCCGRRFRAVRSFVGKYIKLVISVK